MAKFIFVREGEVTQPKETRVYLRAVEDGNELCFEISLSPKFEDEVTNRLAALRLDDPSGKLSLRPCCGFSPMFKPFINVEGEYEYIHVED